MKSIEQLENDLAATKEKISAMPYKLRALWCNGKAISDLLETKRGQIFNEISNHPNPSPLDPNAMAHAFRTLGAGTAALAELQAVMAMIEVSPEWKDAQRLITPLVGEVARLERELATARQKIARAEQDRLEKIEAAKAAALAEIEQKFATA